MVDKMVFVTVAGITCGGDGIGDDPSTATTEYLLARFSIQTRFRRFSGREDEGKMNDDNTNRVTGVIVPRMVAMKTVQKARQGCAEGE